MTESGVEEAEKSHVSIKARQERLRSLSRSPETASIVSVFSNSAMAVLKLIAAFLFNSMALIADGFDSFVDVVSAVTVFLGIKHERELVSSTFIIFMMFGTAGYIGYESVTRLISPEPLEVSPLAIIAAVVSGGVCYVMSIYQHYVGKRSGSISLLTQSVD
ncbi:cation transporter [Candidatus Bipolaricaulota bacterium]|nr:cation transporter [Candidatus Bipolaricaulota bacterium]